MAKNEKTEPVEGEEEEAIVVPTKASAAPEDVYQKTPAMGPTETPAPEPEQVKYDKAVLEPLMTAIYPQLLLAEAMVRFSDRVEYDYTAEAIRKATEAARASAESIARNLMA